MADTADNDAAVSDNRRAAVGVWDRPLRLWHWTLAFSVLIAWFTPNVWDGLHRVAGYSVIALLIFRFVWGFLGKRFSRFDRIAPTLRNFFPFLRGLVRGKTGRYLGLNPAGAAMLVAMLIALTMSAITGALSITTRFFGVWWIEDTHAYASDAVIVLALIHIVGTIVVSIVQGENLPRAMVTGRKRQRSR